MKFRILIFSFLILLITSSFGFKRGDCDSKLELKGITDSTFIVEIESNTTFAAQLFYIEDGEYILQEEKSGNGNEEIEFANIIDNRIYKIVVTFSTSVSLCETRQLSGLKL